MGIIQDKILPLILFPALSATAFTLIFGHAVQSGTFAKVEAQCGSSSSLIGIPSPYFLKYTGLRAFDNILCGIVTMFHVALTPNNKPFFLYFFATLGSLSVVQSIEASRKIRSPYLGNPLPVIVGMASQVMSVGAIFPIYWLVFILSGAHSRKGDAGTKVTSAHANAINFGTMALAAPTAAMFLLDNPYATALWQPFPIYVYIAQLAYLQLFPPSSSSSGYKTIQTINFFNFVISAVVHHLVIVSPIMHGGDATVFAELKQLFIPSISVLDPTTVTFEQGVMDFLKWDLIMSASSGVLATLWFARNFTELIAIIGWYVMISLSFGPGAAASAVIAWREAQLNVDDEKESVEKRK